MASGNFKANFLGKKKFPVAKLHGKQKFWVNPISPGH